MSASLYERLGGEAAVMATVDLFYEKVLSDALLSEFFAELDMRAQIKKQTAFMMHAFGGPEEYRGRDLREAHAHLVKERGLGDAHFDAVAKHLHDALTELKVEGGLIDEVLALVGSTRSEVLSR